MASLRRRPPTVVWIWLGLMAFETIEALVVQKDGLYGAVVIIVFQSAYMLLFFLRFRAVWIITAFVNTVSLILIVEGLFGGGSSRGPTKDINDLFIHLGSLVLLLTPAMRAYFFKRERAPRIPPRPDVQSPERRAGWRARLRSISTPSGWQRDWPRMERLDLVKIEGTETVIYPSPEAKQRSWSAIAALALLFAAQFVLAREVFPRIFGILGLILVPLVALRVSRAWKGPALLLDDIGLKNLFRKSKDYVVLWREISSQIRSHVAKSGTRSLASSSRYSRTLTPISHAARQTLRPSRLRSRRIIAGNAARVAILGALPSAFPHAPIPAILSNARGAACAANGSGGERPG